MADVPDSVLIESLEAIEQYGNVSAAARALNMPRTTLSERRRIAALRGLHLSEGAQRAITGAGLKPAEARGGWIVKVDPETGSRESTRWEAPAITETDFIERLRNAFDDLEPAKPIPALPASVESDMLALIPHADVHIGMVASADHVGRDYNRELAAERFKHGVTRCISAQPPCAEAIILNAGDLLHANDDSDATPRHKHKLKVEGTHHDNLGLAIELTVYAIDMALTRHGKVTYRGIPGNHDPNIPSPLSYALRAYYRNEPRVEIVVSQDEFWQRNWGNVFLSGHHGHGRKPKEVCAEIPGKWPEQWGMATEWHYFSAHRHNYQSVPYGPIRHHQLPCVCSLDPHAASGPYADTAGMMSMTFHKQRGLEATFSVRL